jgi:hypothetical protein
MGSGVEIQSDAIGREFTKRKANLFISISEQFKILFAYYSITERLSE